MCEKMLLIENFYFILFLMIFGKLDGGNNKKIKFLKSSQLIKKIKKN